MENHMDGARPNPPAAPARTARSPVKEKKLAEALRRNLTRRKQAGAKPAEDKNG